MACTQNGPSAVGPRRAMGKWKRGESRMQGAVSAGCGLGIYSYRGKPGARVRSSSALQIPPASPARIRGYPSQLRGLAELCAAWAHRPHPPVGAPRLHPSLLGPGAGQRSRTANPGGWGGACSPAGCIAQVTALSPLHPCGCGSDWLWSS